MTIRLQQFGVDTAEPLQIYQNLENLRQNRVRTEPVEQHLHSRMHSRLHSKLHSQLHSQLHRPARPQLTVDRRVRGKDFPTFAGELIHIPDEVLKKPKLDLEFEMSSS